MAIAATAVSAESDSDTHRPGTKDPVLGEAQTRVNTMLEASLARVEKNFQQKVDQQIALQFESLAKQAVEVRMAELARRRDRAHLAARSPRAFGIARRQLLVELATSPASPDPSMLPVATSSVQPRKAVQRVR